MTMLGVLALAAATSPAWQGMATAPPGVARTTLGAHVLVGQEEGRADPVARTPPLATAAQGSSLLAFVAGYAVNDAAPTDGFDNPWRGLGPPVVYRDYDGRFDVRAYLAPEAHGGPRHRVQVAKPGVPEGELTLVVAEARNAGRLVDVAQTYPEPALRQVSGSVTTDGPALLVAAWFGDASGLDHTVVAGAGFRVVERFTALPPNSAVQAVLAVREVERAGSYRASWYAHPRQGAVLWLMAFAPRAQAPVGQHVSPP